MDLGRSLKTKNSGQALILALVFLAIIASTSAALLGHISSVARTAKKTGEERLAIQIAQAGIDKALFCLNQTDGTNCGGTFGSNYTGENNVSIAPGVFTTTITTIDINTKEIESTAYIPNAADPLYQKTIRAQAGISSTEASFNYGLQVGDGGLVMKNNSEVEGSVYSNGTIEGAQLTTITGDAFAAGGANSTPDQEWTTTNGDFNFGQDSPQTDVAQSFVPSATGEIIKVSFYIKKFGLPSNATVRILSDNNGVPSKTTLESGTLNASNVTLAYGWVDVSLDDPLNVNAGTRYWVSIDSSNNTLNYWIIASDTPGGYTSGQGMYAPSWNAGNPDWDDSGGDFNFKIWPGGVVTKIIDMTIGANAHANTIEDSIITGDAYYQTLTDTTVLGTQNPGSPNPAPEDFPISPGQIEQWKQDAEDGGIITGDYLLENLATDSLGPKKITGNLTVKNNAVLTITGTIYVQGNILIDNEAVVSLTPSYGANSGVIVADGTIEIKNNSILSGSGVPGSYIMFISNATGTAMPLDNNGTGAIFFAPNGKILIKNNFTANQITAKSIQLDNNAVITYESGLANVNFSSGPGGGWVFTPGTWRIIK